MGFFTPVHLEGQVDVLELGPSRKMDLASLQPYYVQEGCATSAYPLLVGTILFTLVMHT